MNLKPEQIPDEVVEAAMRAEQEFYAEKRYTSFSDIGSTDARDAMKAALAAALPVLLGEPVLFQSRDRFMEFNWGPWITFEYEQDRDSDFIRMSNADGWQAEKRDLYTLPTQDTPNADQ